MYIDPDIELREDLPKELKEYQKELQDYYDVDDWFNFDTLFEVVEARVKAYYLAGIISSNDLHAIFKKYGIE